MDRRTFFGAATVTVLLTASFNTSLGGDYDNPRRSIPDTDGVRRRIRRRAYTRVIGGRSCWVVPTQLAVGWELVNADRIVVVRALTPESASVTDEGQTRQIDIIREDNASNGQELVGSVVDDADKTTPVRVAGAAP